MPPDPAAPDPTVLIRFAEAVVGLLRPLSVLDHLAREVKAFLAPTALAAVALNQQGEIESANGDPQHPLLTALLTAALQTGAPQRSGGGGATVLALPFRGRQSVLGAFAVAWTRKIDPTATLAGLSAVTAVALEGARIVEAADWHREGWEEALDSLGLAICILDRGGRIERVNRVFAELLGTTAAGALRLPWADVIPAAWHSGIRAALAGEAAETRSGDHTVAVSAVRGLSSGREVLVFEDQTERQRLQERLLQSEKLSAIGQLIAGVAHDLNNPLTSVVGFADFLAESAEVPPRIREPLRVIQQEAERASKIVKNLLSFARRQETRQPAALRPILDATVGLFRNNLNAEAITLTLDVAPDLPDLDLNPTQIQQVFVNLIQNAAQALAAAGHPGTIQVSARRWMTGAMVEVSDTGPGMDATLAAQAFEPFFTTKPEGQGTGLGLSISQGIVKEHGGRITLTTAPGAGATFTVELPGRVSARTAAPVPAESVPMRPLRVLVVDDEPHILHYIRATLEAWGHQVETASDGAAALERALAVNFDLIISDLRMPRAGGREFYEALRDRRPEAALRVAFSTGDTVRGDTLDFLEAQGRPCLQKPFSLAELRQVLYDAAAR
jgi:two-component system NtrC family sensor kinase